MDFWVWSQRPTDLADTSRTKSSWELHKSFISSLESARWEHGARLHVLESVRSRRCKEQDRHSQWRTKCSFSWYGTMSVYSTMLRERVLLFRGVLGRKTETVTKKW